MKILNFGSLNIDYVYSVDHFVMPGETLMSRGLSFSYGGKGLNQSIAVAKAGSPIFHIGKIGHDGKGLRDMLTKNGVNAGNVAECGERTGHAIIQVDKSGQNCIILHSGANYEIDADFIESSLSPFGEGDILIMQNEISGNARIMETAHRKGIRIAFNPSPITPDIPDLPLEFVNWFILNEIEGGQITREKQPEKIADTLLSRYPGCAVMLTLGKMGALYKDSSKTCSHGIYKVDRVDTTGAGDTFTGYFISGIAKGLQIEEILRRASVASSIAVTRKGAAASIPDIKEVLDAKLLPVTQNF